MIRIRKVLDDVNPANASAIAEARRILKAQFPGMDPADIDKLPDRLRDPLKYHFVTRLFTAETSSGRVVGVALLLYFAKENFCYLELLSAAPGRTGGGVGGLLYDRVREEARALGAHGIYLECLPDDPALSPDPAIRRQNAARLKFYERYGALPIAGTSYETPLEAGDTNPPYLVFDGLGITKAPIRKQVKSVIRAILERKYATVCPPEYVEMTVASVRDDPVRLRPPRYIRPGPAALAATAAGDAIVLVVNHRHDVHHIHDRGYVEAPARVRAILAEIEPSGLFRRHEPRRFPDRHITEVHDRRLFDYLRRACREAGTKSLYPYVFPIRNAARPPRERSVLAGYYCIDTFTPLNASAWEAARLSVDCTLTAADALLAGKRLAYALVRPPGHHAETRVFGGFCYFCNPAIAAHYLSRWGRVAILDIDYHHGNGQQEIFYRRDDVLTVSVHGDPSFAYPYFSGFRDETGTGRGAGFNLNLPLSETITPQAHRAAVETALARIRRHAPDFLVVATGFDTAKADPTGTWSNRAEDFETLGRLIGSEGWATLVVQEGGYRIRTLGANARRYFTGLHAGAMAARGRRPAPPRRTNGVGRVSFRRTVRAGDPGAVRSLVAATGFFTAAEEAIAEELVSERLQRGAASGYHFLFAERGSRLDGYACFGPIDGTRGAFDLYWIAVHPDRQRSGLGRDILSRAEAIMAAERARCIWVDTSGRPQYASTRAFYEQAGYRRAAELADFYAPGDGKVIYVKDIASRNDDAGGH